MHQKVLYPRPNLPKDAYENAITFQVLDVLVNERPRELEVLLFGVTSQGNSLEVSVSDFRHSFYVGAGTSAELVRAAAGPALLKCALEEVFGMRSIFVNHRPRERCFQVVAPDYPAFLAARAACTAAPDALSVFNGDVDAKTRFLVSCGLVGCGWAFLS